MNAASTAAGAREREVHELSGFLAALVASEPGGLLEIRARRRRGGMTQRFYPADALRLAARELLELGAHTDVYVGCAPRMRRAGGRRALGRVWVLWADCDDHASVARLEAFAPAHAILVRSGTERNTHAYWPLRNPISPAQATATNTHLAAALGACQSAVTAAAAILRAPGTLNFKHSPPRVPRAPARQDRGFHRRGGHRRLRATTA